LSIFEVFQLTRGWLSLGYVDQTMRMFSDLAIRMRRVFPESAAHSLKLTSYFFLLIALYWVYGNRPLVAEPWQWADDGLYFRQVEGIEAWASGNESEWLGAYDATILAKPPFFAIFIAFLDWLGISLRLAEFGLLVGLPFLMRAAFHPLTRVDGWRFAVCTVFLVGLPFLPGELRLLRTALQAATSGACLVAAIGLALRANRPVNEKAWWAGMLGFFFAVSYLNREESIWLLPTVAGALVIAAVGAWFHKATRTILVPAFCCFVGGGLPIGTVTLLNYTSYGVALTAERRAPGLTRVYQVLTSLEPSERQRYVPINTATRLKAYAVSPTFARLRPFLEGPATDDLARNPGHLMLNGWPADAREFFVSTFEFALRDAAFRAGNKTAPETEKFFQAISEELTAAIAAGRIAAGNVGPGLLAAPLPGDSRRILVATVVSLQALFLVADMVLLPPDASSSGDSEAISRMGRMTHSRLAPTKDGSTMPPAGPFPAERQVVFDLMLWVQRLFYAGGAALALGSAVLAIRDWRSPNQHVTAAVAIMLFSALLLFSLAMGVVHVLGLPLLNWPRIYNALGFAPLSVLAVFGFVVGTTRTTSVPRLMILRPIAGFQKGGSG
jgi:hypothetical protein